MNNHISKLLAISIIISVLSVIIFIQIDNKLVFGFEENILSLQTGIVSTADQDYAVSQEFKAKIFQDGRIMRLSGITTTGEPYYLYQKIVGGNTIVKGKILIDGEFISLLQKSIVEKEKIETKDKKELLILVKQPHHGYYYDTYTLTAKVFQSNLNPRGDFYQKDGYIEGVKIDVTLNRFNELLTSFSGVTDQFGAFTGKYLWKYTDSKGEYNVTVTADDGVSTSTQYFNTFYRGYISNFTG